MTLNNTVLVALLKSESMSLMHLVKLSNHLFQDKHQLSLLLSKLTQSLTLEIDWPEKDESIPSTVFLERAYEYLLALLPSATAENELQLIDLFACTEALLVQQSENKNEPQQRLILAAERVNERIADILQPVSASFSDLNAKRFRRLLSVLFGSRGNLNSRVLALQRIITHVLRLVDLKAEPVDASASSILAYLLTDITMNVGRWTTDMVTSLFNHAVQLAVASSLSSQSVFAHSLVTTIQFCLDNSLAYSHLDEKQLKALYTSLLHGLITLLDNPETQKTTSSLLSNVELLSQINRILQLLDDQALQGRYNDLMLLLIERKGGQKD